jgi:hypothetical protein
MAGYYEYGDELSGCSVTELVGNYYAPAILTICNAVIYFCGFCMVLTVNSDYFFKQH